jgi:YD repeat-containing protein
MTYNMNAHQEAATDALGRVTLNTYDDFGNLIAQTDPTGAITTYTYRSFAATKEENDGLCVRFKDDVASWDAVLGGGNHRPKFPAPQTPHPPSLSLFAGGLAWRDTSAWVSPCANDGICWAMSA